MLDCDAREKHGRFRRKSGGYQDETPWILIHRQKEVVEKRQLRGGEGFQGSGRRRRR